MSEYRVYCNDIDRFNEEKSAVLLLCSMSDYGACRNDPDRCIVKQFEKSCCCVTFFTTNPTKISLFVLHLNELLFENFPTKQREKLLLKIFLLLRKINIFFVFFL